MRHLFFIAVILLLTGCQSRIIDAEYEELKDKETKFLLSIEGEDFYEKDAVFDGHLEVKENYFVMNFMNQYSGNFILTFSGVEKWYDQKVITGKLYGTAASNLMIGKLVNKAENKGVGYLMSEGRIKAITISQEKLVFEIEGVLKKYPKVMNDDPSYKFKGHIISKKPTFSEYAIRN